MHYVMSDIHGCFYEYQKALKMINFNDHDTLYIVGDCIDRGLEPIKVLKDTMIRKNVKVIAGNHELMALKVLKNLCVEITVDNVETTLNTASMEAYIDWIVDGGQTTIDKFKYLSLVEKYQLLDYLGSLPIYKELTVNDENYLLVHGGLEPFDFNKTIDEYTIEQLLFSKANYDTIYFEDCYTITGHTPTCSIKGNQGTIIKKNNHIAIDCGCVYGYNLAVYCLETKQEFYIPYQNNNQ